MGRIRDRVEYSKIVRKSLKVDCYLDNGEVMEVEHFYGESFENKGFDFNGAKQGSHQLMGPYLEKYGVECPEFIYCLLEVLREAYGDRGVRPFQEFKCKINDDTFTAYMIILKEKGKTKDKDSDIIKVSIKESLSEERIQEMEELKEDSKYMEI